MLALRQLDDLSKSLDFSQQIDFDVTMHLNGILPERSNLQMNSRAARLCPTDASNAFQSFQNPG
jgi:hypothetical protein